MFVQNESDVQMYHDPPNDLYFGFEFQIDHSRRLVLIPEKLQIIIMSASEQFFKMLPTNIFAEVPQPYRLLLTVTVRDEFGQEGSFKEYD